MWRYRKDLEPDLRGKRRNLKALRSVTFFTWDFGGQEEYYVTHQCFLSTRSLYLVVWDVERGEEGIEQLGPWLHNIQVRWHQRMGRTIWKLSNGSDNNSPLCSPSLLSLPPSLPPPPPPPPGPSSRLPSHHCRYTH